MESGRFRLRAAAAITIMIGISIALWGGWSDLKLWWYTDSEPQRLTAQQLAEDGPGNNLHVLVTDYTTSSDGWGTEKVGYFRVHPKARAKEQASLVLRIAGGSAIFGTFIPEDGLSGVVLNGDNAFNADVRLGLKKLGPINFDKVWIIDHNRRPPPWWSFLLKVLGGLALVGVGAGMFWAAGSDDD